MQGAIQAFAPCMPTLKKVFTENIEESAAVLRPSNSKIALFFRYAIILSIQIGRDFFIDRFNANA